MSTNISGRERARAMLCLALDISGDLCDVVKTLVPLAPLIGVVKLNSVFLRLHKTVIDVVKGFGLRTFVDLKCHDIPETVMKEAKALEDLEIDFFTIHLSGLSPMIRETCAWMRNKKGNSNGKTKILGITVLTSIDQNMFKNELKMAGSIRDHAIHLALLGKSNGIDGVVCSGDEARAVRAACGSDFFIATPGIRLSAGIADDQKRVVTPYDAVYNESNMIIMGRPLLSGGKTAAELILDNIERALEAQEISRRQT